jgi:polyhydroxybutyrate depolymerase
MNAQGARWDATPECCNLAGRRSTTSAIRVVDGRYEIYAVAPRRIRLVGHSNGGYMAYRYACEHPVDVDRIAVLAG